MQQFQYDIFEHQAPEPVIKPTPKPLAARLTSVLRPETPLPEPETVKQTQPGVCYLSRIPPYMQPSYLRKLLQHFQPERIYLIPEDKSTKKHRVIKGGNKRTSFTQGWVQFKTKAQAKAAAQILNGNKVVQKKGSFYSDDMWSIKYLPKFTWTMLTERLAYDQRIRRERLRHETRREEKQLEQYREVAIRSTNKGKMLERKKKIAKQRQTEQLPQ